MRVNIQSPQADHAQSSARPRGSIRIIGAESVHLARVGAVLRCKVGDYYADGLAEC